MLEARMSSTTMQLCLLGFTRAKCLWGPLSFKVGNVFAQKRDYEMDNIEVV